MLNIMPVSGWVGFAIIVFLCTVAVISGIILSDTSKTDIIATLIGVLVIIITFFCFRWYYANTARGRRAIVDEKSNITNGMERTITVYTANGDIIAQYNGKIDIEANDGGYVKFDFDGNRYIYYNCFVESVAEIK